MKHRYIGKSSVLYPELLADSVYELKIATIPALGITKVLSPFTLDYPSIYKLRMDWYPLTAEEEKIVDRAERKYKKLLVDYKEAVKIYEAFNRGETNKKISMFNGKYYDISNFTSEEILDMANAMAGFSDAGDDKNKIYVVNNPFMSREGQFEEGKRSLVIGLDMVALSRSDSYSCFLGKNRKVYYQIKSSDALSLSQKYKSTWINKSGRQLAILPLKDFNRVEVLQ